MKTMMLLGACAMCLAGAGKPVKWIDLDAGWRFRPDPGDVGLAEQWQATGFNDEDWAVIDAGKRWEDQGFSDVDGVAWYRRRIDVPGAWRGLPIWFVLGGLNDAGTVFCNGERVNAFGDETERSMYATPIIADLTGKLRFDGTDTLVVRVFDWGASGGLWQPPCEITPDSTRLPLESVAACRTGTDRNRITVDLDFTSFGNDRGDATIRVDVADNDLKGPIATASKQLAADEFETAVTVRLGEEIEFQSSRVVLVSAEGERGRPAAGLWAIPLSAVWPRAKTWSHPYRNLKVRNNFVTELLTVSEQGTHTFLNPRDGWVFFCVTEDVEVVIDKAPTPVVWRADPDTGALEAMHWLPEGEHRVSVALETRLEIRTVPEMAFCYYPSGAHISAYGPYDWSYVKQHVLPHVNVLISRDTIPQAEFDQWTREGRWWIANSSLPGLNDREAPTADAVFDVWAKNPGVASPGFSGLMVDEFLSSSREHYRAWGEAVTRLSDVPSFRDRTFYAWCGNLYQLEAGLEFSRLLAQLDHRFSWEKYLREMPDEDGAERLLHRHLQRDLAAWQRKMPGIERYLVMCLGYLSAPPETLNVDPTVDYHVFMDMQFRFLATDPAFWGLYGVMEYMTAYADEESVRWAHKLFRHYCIEGSTEPFTSDPYVLPHIKNPDFEDGLKAWTIEPAQGGLISAHEMDGFSWLEGRYPKVSLGDRFCRMKRSPVAPNRIQQTIRALEPGRLYSVKFISADIGQLDQKKELALSITVENAEVIEPDCFQVAYPSCYSHEVGEYTRDHPAWFNFHRVVFRATGKTAELVISDWATATAPGGHVGQETAFNFVEVQPWRN